MMDTHQFIVELGWLKLVQFLELELQPRLIYLKQVIKAVAILYLWFNSSKKGAVGHARIILRVFIFKNKNIYNCYGQYPKS